MPPAGGCDEKLTHPTACTTDTRKDGSEGDAEFAGGCLVGKLAHDYQ